MFKDYDKYLSTSLKVYIFVLMIIFIMKLIGMNYFGIDYQNDLIIFIDSKINIPIVNNIVQFSLLAFQLYLMSYIAFKRKPNIISIFIVTLLNVIASFFIFKYKLDYLYYIFDVLLVVIYFLLNKVKFKRILSVIIINNILQIISCITRNNSLVEYSFTISIILDIDYILMLMIYCKLIKEGINLCQLHGLSLQKKINLKKSLIKLQKYLNKFKKLPKVEKLSIVIYIILSLIWNTLNIILILFVAKLNNTFIECIFILTSFWLSKKAFGRAFHLSNMAQCFIVSNLTYYVLNRVTTPLGISIIIPILLGVGLSYVTSKLVKKTYKPLYKGMPSDLFEEIILKVTDKNSVKYKICYDFYIAKQSDISLSFKYNYSVAGIRKIKDRINDKIKELR